MANTIFFQDANKILQGQLKETQAPSRRSLLPGLASPRGATFWDPGSHRPQCPSAQEGLQAAVLQWEVTSREMKCPPRPSQPNPSPSGWQASVCMWRPSARLRYQRGTKSLSIILGESGGWEGRRMACCARNLH